MIIQAVAEVLNAAGVAPPSLNAIASDANNYTALLLQPVGVIDASGSGVQSRDRGFATAQFGKFFEDVAASQPDLVVTPEYSVPWQVLEDAIRRQNGGPAIGTLWVIGCESIRYSQLTRLRADLEGVADVIFEPLTVDDAKFVDPLAYVFRAPVIGHDGISKLIVLVQFKTRAMGDPHDFERNHLQLGTRVYQFGQGLGIRLTTFICSDVLGFPDPHAEAVRDRGLIIHLQLNDKRQHPSMRAFRERLLSHAGKSTEVLTLNWARDTRVYLDGEDTRFTKFAGSAWWIKAEEIDLGDASVAANHRKGMYYTRHGDHRTHAMFLNFGQAVFSLTSSKVDRSKLPGPVGNRRGPQLNIAKIWDRAIGMSSDTDVLDDGFAFTLPEGGGATASLRAAYETCPLGCERLISICSGKCVNRQDWPTVKQLRSFGLATEEVIFRFTFCQPMHPESVEFRRQHLRRCSYFWNALSDGANLPAVLKDVADGFALAWSIDRPNQNLKGSGGDPATVIYLGDSSKAEAESVHDAVRKRLHQTLPEDPNGKEHASGSSFRAKQRIAVWYVDNAGNRHLHVRTPLITDAQGDPADIRRAS